MPVVPYLLRHKQTDKDEWPPVSGLKRKFGERNKSVDINQRDDCAFGRKLGAVVKSFHELNDVLNLWRFPE